ncbi:hypothetical protein KL86PLE_130460 [uncultured Pleomorphomonas sp.]|uniref:Uncharacterized protein n=1 Tax=uncultured Pleomorphomonas sp. TaxID=442121 RepID=A0A212LCH9_9HYPH|nr:hypothetical protein KL86PLE_130460 [uncultured Pleomorphomonas sp.]
MSVPIGRPAAARPPAMIGSRRRPCQDEPPDALCHSDQRLIGTANSPEDSREGWKKYKTNQENRLGADRGGQLEGIRRKAIITEETL